MKKPRDVIDFDVWAGAVVMRRAEAVVACEALDDAALSRLALTGDTMSACEWLRRHDPSWRQTLAALVQSAEGD